MKKILAILVLLATVAVAADVKLIDCNENYNQCITTCCNSCGSTLSYDSNGDLICNAGTQANPDQQCISACTPCAQAYQQCVGAIPVPSSDVTGKANLSCCGSTALVGAVMGLAFIKSKV